MSPAIADSPSVGNWINLGMHATVTWQQDQQYDAESQSGHHVTMDADAAHRAGASPMELVLMALCGCTSVDVVSILRKKREPLPH